MYVGRNRAQECSIPSFETELRNVHQRANDLLIRTNNLAKAWHRHINSIVKCQQPSHWIL